MRRIIHSPQTIVHRLRIAILLILGIAWLILPQAKAFAATYYLDAVNGDDANPGTSELPWKTIDKAKSIVARGDTVFIRPGNYGDVVFSGSPVSQPQDWEDKITYISETPHTAVFTQLSISGNYHRYLEFNGIKITPDAAVTAVSVAGSDYLRFINLDIQGTWDEVKYGPGISDVNLYNSLSTGMYFTESTAYLMNDIIIEGCNLQDLKAGIGFANNAGTGTKVVGCTIHHLAGSAIGLSVNNKGTNGQILIEGNHIYNTQQVYEPEGDFVHGSGIEQRTGNVIIRGNIVHDFGSTRGIRAYQGSFPETGYTDVLIENNLLYDTLNYPVEFVDVGSNFIVRNNTIIGYYSGSSDLGWRYYTAMIISFASLIPDGSGFSLFNNIIVGRVDVPEGSNDQNYISTMNEGKNIIWSLYGDNTGSGGHGWSVSLPPGSTSKVITTRYNPYPGYTADYFEGSGNFFIGGPDFDAYSYSRPGGEPHGINLNDAYKLASGSDAIGFADLAYAPATDLPGISRDAQPDAGCYEYIPTYYVSPMGGTVMPHNGLTKETAFTLAEAQSYANYHINEEITFLLASGDYGDFSANTERTAWVTWKADMGAHPEFSRIIIGNYPDWKNVYLIFDGLTVRSSVDDAAVLTRYARHIKFLNLNIIGNGYLLSQYANNEPAISLGQGSEDVVIDNCIIHGTEGISGKLEYLSGFTSGVYIGNGTDVTVKNCDISECALGIYAQGNNINILNNNIHKLSWDGIVFYGVNGLTIENNQLHDLYIYKPTLIEIPTETTWNLDGTVMTNPNAQWNTPGETLVTRGMEIHVISGANALIGDGERNPLRAGETTYNFNVISISPDGTQITLSRGIADGGQPSNVNYYIKSQAHTDLIQANAYAEQSNVIIRGNLNYDTEEQIWHINPLIPDNPDGVGGYNFLIENNLLWAASSDAVEEARHFVNLNSIDGLIFRNNIVIGHLRISGKRNLSLLNNIISLISIEDTAGLIENDYNIINRGRISLLYSLGPHSSTIGTRSGEWIIGTTWNDPRFTGIFADYYNGNFQHASATSLGVGHGDPLNSPLIDILGNPRDAAPDAGCYEYIPTTFLYGDVNADAEISAFDAALAAHIAVDLEHPDIKNRAAPEVSGDGEVSAYDAALIAQKAVGLIERFPVEE